MKLTRHEMLHLKPKLDIWKHDGSTYTTDLDTFVKILKKYGFKNFKEFRLRLKGNQNILDLLKANKRITLHQLNTVEKVILGADLIEDKMPDWL